MSVVERIGDAVMKVSEQEAKETVGKGAAPTTTKPNGARNVVDIDFDRLKALGVYTPDNTSAQQALELRAIKRRLLRRIGFLRDSGDRKAQRGVARQKNMIMVTSTAAGEGKTFSALNLAMSFAFEDKIDILLVDADVQRPKVLSRLGLEPSPGVTDKLLEPSLDIDALCIKASSAPLSILPQGRHVERPSDVYDTEAAKTFWAGLSAARSDRLVIVDAPPVLATTEAVILAKYVDEIVFVVEAGKTPEAAITAALDELLDINTNISLMLNRCLIGAGGSHYGSYEYYDRSGGDENAPGAQSKD